MQKLSIINENIFDGIGRRSKGGVVRKEDEPEQVDLGLPSGTIWAAWNVGASSKEEYGNYYAWGETKPKDKYTMDNYKFGTEDNLTKYNEKDGKTILDPEDDAAHVVLGGKWHIPTEEQIQELLDDKNTTNEESRLNGVKGRLFKSRINGNELFFPYSGEKRGSSIWGNVIFHACWSSSLIYEISAKVFYSDADYSGYEDFYRSDGICVRGVFEKK